MFKKIIVITCSLIFIVSFSCCGNAIDTVIDDGKDYAAENNYDTNNKNRNNNIEETQGNESEINDTQGKSDIKEESSITQEKYNNENETNNPEEDIEEKSLEILNSIYALPETIETLKATGYYSDSITDRSYSLPDDEESIKNFREWYYSKEIKENAIYDFMKNFDYENYILDSEADFYVNDKYAFTYITVGLCDYIGNKSSDIYYMIYDKNVDEWINSNSLD